MESNRNFIQKDIALLGSKWKVLFGKICNIYVYMWTLSISIYNSLPCFLYYPSFLSLSLCLVGPAWPRKWGLNLHMFSCRTKLAMLLCLKYLGSTSLANRPWSNTWKLVPFCKGEKDGGSQNTSTTRGDQEEVIPLRPTAGHALNCHLEGEKTDNNF